MYQLSIQKYRDYSPGFNYKRFILNENDVINKIKYTSTLKNISIEDIGPLLMNIMKITYKDNYLPEDEKKELTLKVIYKLINSSSKLNSYKELLPMILPRIIDIMIDIDKGNIVINKNNRIIKNNRCCCFV